MSVPALHLYLPWGNRVFLTGRHGLWPLCGHLYASLIWGLGVLGQLHPSVSCLLAGWLPHPHFAHLPHVPTDILWPQCHWSLLLWYFTPASLVLLGCHPEGDHRLPGLSGCAPDLLHSHRCVLWQNCLDAAAYPLGCRAPEGLLHLCSPPDCGEPLLRHSLLYVCSDQSGPFYQLQQGGFCLLLHRHSNVQPSHLQSSKQRGEGSSGQSLFLQVLERSVRGRWGSSVLALAF